MVKRTHFAALIGLSLVLNATALHAAQSGTPAAPAGKEVLEQKRIHADYNDGNFEKVTAALEGFMARNKTYSQADSVFIAKHLAVVYSANPETREKGKYYMFRLLELLPSAKLVDMFVSDEIDRIFEKVREEFLARQKSFGVDTAQVSLPPKASPAQATAKQDQAQAPPGPSRPSPPTRIGPRTIRPRTSWRAEPPWSR